MAPGGVHAHAHHLDVVLFQVAHAVAEAAGLLGAAGGVVLGIKIEQHDLPADEVGQFPHVAALVLALHERRGIADLRPGIGLRPGRHEPARQQSHRHQNDRQLVVHVPKHNISRNSRKPGLCVGGDFGLRWQAKRDTAIILPERGSASRSNFASQKVGEIMQSVL